ncbi:hypothetical protein TL16_g04151 [Triparma laevis f. inornata]|uniref:Dipeptidase n=1 Tax=Triparma laevis f. inornata TaxID=1714386 RepID=A0A9W7A6Y1_9STRA|nr:hypothetical protein TL16_g04151 [Triparma laevis f. inornata]
MQVTPEASTSNEAMIAYNADSASLYGSLYHYPRTGGGSRDLYDWDSGAFLGSIPEAEKTHNVVGNCNEVGLCIGETTFGGLEELCETFPGSKVDYGSLIWVTLQRASNAREAIKVMDNLMQTYGYASEGESFSITDSREVWINEVIGKGTYEKGSVWVAKKIPAGYVSSHANQARITTFEWDDESKAMYAHDVMSFAQKIGLIKEGNGVEKGAFSFSDTYDPVTFEGARFCEGRVWSFFSSVMGEEFEKEYVDYASGFNLTNRMPLWVKPAEKISLSDVFSHMRNHFEGSELAFDGDVGAGGFGAPYRWRPLTWEYGDDTYVNERAIGTQQTGWNFVASVRPSMPTPMQAVIWFGADDSATTVRVPFYASATELPLSFVGKGPQDGVVPPMMIFDLNSAFYVTNLVSNWAYSRWSDIYPVVLEKIVEYEASFISQLHEVDQKVLGLINNGQQEEALNLMNAFAQKLGNGFTQQWFGFFGELFVRFRDGYDITPNSEDPECGCTVGGIGYNDATYGRIAEETGDQYKEPSGDDALKERQFNPKNKLKVRGV